jgi:hypothetical protein
MSCYEWERGKIKIPRSEFSLFKKNLTTAYNDYMLRLKAIADDIYNDITIESKGKKKYNYQLEITSRIYNCINADYYASEIIASSMLPLNKQGKPKKPKSKDFSKKTNRDNAYGYNISLNKSDRTAIWCVEEGNRVCDDARTTFLGKRFFSLLNQMDWKNGSGGLIVGNDEYNRDSAEYNGGGGNYVKNIFGSKDYWSKK